MIEVLIIYGGDSVESEISAQSANGILKNIDQSRFTPSLINVKDLKIISELKKIANLRMCKNDRRMYANSTKKLD